MEDIRSVGVLGAGTMGHGIAEVVALAGLDVWVYDVQKSFLDGGLEKLRWSIAKLVDKGMISPEKADAALERVHGTLDLEQLSQVDAVIEAVPEDLKVKSDVFSSLVRSNHHALLASNTSTIPITEIAASTGRPESFVGLHFFNPPVLMPLVEVIRGEKTDDKTLDLGVALAKRLGKEVVLCRKDVPGFLVNRILGPLLNEAAWTVGRGEANVEEIDSAAVYKVGLPMGLFEVADYTGIDVIYKAAEAVKSREPSSILGAPLFREKFEQGKLGKKTGEGFYLYSDKQPRPTISKEKGEGLDPLLFFSVAVNSAAWLIRNGVCTKEDLDRAVRLGLGFPEGILRMADGWGIDRVVSVLKAKQSVYGQDYTPDPLLHEMVARGELGAESGKGFYDYSASEKRLEDVTLTKSPPVAWITLNRPQRLNTLTPRLIDELETVAKDAVSDDSIRVVVIRGEGAKAFSAGADLTAFGFSSPTGAFDAARRLFEVFSLFEKMPKPVIAAINGYAFGGGCELALACDFRLASESSQIGLTETSLGLIPGAGGTQRLVRLVGLSKAKEMIYFGLRLQANEALRVGLVDKVLANDQFQKGVEEFANSLAKRAPLSLRFAKLAINTAGQVPTDVGQYFEAGAFGLLVGTDDASEGISAFLSKRDPEFKGG
ncbi:MAG: enoyl-CoA hydratase-related protein [Thaumarchaeota archaeon]|nr:enoyl-CoA hydratase-related protein [Nitrososphaerota archaeon]